MQPRELLDTFERNYRLPDDQRLLPQRVDNREFYIGLMFTALRAVLDQHPLVHDDGDRCRGCWNQVHDTYERWPCATVRAITTALEAS